MALHYRNQLPTAPQGFSARPQFSGFMKPCRFEGEVQNLELIAGKIPPEIDGTFYRVMPDPQLPPRLENDVWFNGDGNISAFQIKSGRCHFKQRYVRTEKFVRERQAQRALMGGYRNKFTDEVEFKVRSTANTNVIYFNGRLLACKEDSLPYALNPETLETIGLDDFDGQLPSVTFTAHPKEDPATKELLCFGYEAKGDGTPDICYFSIGPDGKFLETVWLVAPVVAMIHDFAVTENWILFPLIPLTCDLERMKKGGEHWQWNPDIPFYMGIIPRRGAKPEDVKWFRAPNAFPGHSVNAYENPDGCIIFDLAMSDKNVFFWWPDKEGNAPVPQDIQNHLVRFTVDPRSSDMDLAPPEVLLGDDCEFPRIDDRYHTKPHSHVFVATMDPKFSTDFGAIGRVMGGGFPPYNSFAHYDYKAKLLQKYSPGKTHLCQEPVFIPRSQSAAEGDGWLMALVNNYSTMLSELHIIDTADFEKPCAIINLPMRLRAGLHGNWVDGQDLALAD